MFGRKKEKEVKIENPLLISLMQNDELVVHLDPSQVGNPSQGGVVLADIAIHFSRALVGIGAASGEDEALDEIKRVFNAELDNPQGNAEGGIVS